MCFLNSPNTVQTIMVLLYVSNFPFRAFNHSKSLKQIRLAYFNSVCSVLYVLNLSPTARHSPTIVPTLALWAGSRSSAVAEF